MTVTKIAKRTIKERMRRLFIFFIFFNQGKRHTRQRYKMNHKWLQDNDLDWQLNPDPSHYPK